jgi:hypothetical protein
MKVAALAHNQLRKSASNKPNAPSPSWKSMETNRLTSQPGASTIQFKNEKLKAATTKATPARLQQIASAGFVSLAKRWLAGCFLITEVADRDDRFPACFYRA